MRYRNDIVKKTYEGKEIFLPKILSDIPKDITDIYVSTETGDRLDTLAFDFYRDASLWWIIASANKIHDAPIAFADGTILRIPVNYQRILNSNM